MREGRLRFRYRSLPREDRPDRLWRRRPAKRVKHEWLWTDWGKRRMGGLSLCGLIEDVKAIDGFKGDPWIKPHSIRHAAATRLLRYGADIRSIQAWLGHSQLQTPAVYLRTDEQQVRKIADLAGFRGSALPSAGQSPNPQQEDAKARRSEFMRLRRRSA